MVTLPTGFTEAEIWLTDFMLQFDDDQDHAVRRVQATVEPNGVLSGGGSYDSATGAFYWKVTTGFEAHPTPPNPDFSFRLSFMIMAVKGQNAVLTRKTLSSFAPSGATCTTSMTAPTCEDAQSLTGVGTAVAPFRFALLSGFEVSLTPGAGIDVSLVRVNSFYSQSGNDAIGRTQLDFRGTTGGAPAQVVAEVDLVAVGLAQAEAHFAAFQKACVLCQDVNNVGASVNDDTVGLVPDPTTGYELYSFGSYVGLRSFELEASTPSSSPIQQIWAGCSELEFRPTLASSASGRSSWVYQYALRSQYPSPVITYDGLNFCYVGFLQVPPPPPAP